MHAVITKRNKPVTSTRWTGTWSNGVPTPTTNAYIDTDYTTATGSFACRDLIVTASAILTIPENTYVKVLKDINQTTTSHIIVKAGGELMLLNVDADVTTARLTAEATYKNLQRLDYAFISSPISGIPVKRLSPGTLDNRFYEYNEESDQFRTINPNTKYTHSSGGYHIRTPTNHPTIANNFNLSVDNLSGGFINKGVFSIPILNKRNGYNLIGNPYNSRLSLRKFYHTNKNLIDDYIYIWENRSNGAPGSAYTVYNTYTNNINNKSINLLPFQSFIVKSKNKNIIENIIFSPNMIITDIDFTLPDRFYLNIFENTYNLPIGGFCYDIKKYKSIFTDNYTPGAIYIKNNDNTVIHQDTENSLQKTLNVGLNLNIYSTYRISLKNLSGIFSGLPTINLYDTLTGSIHNLKNSDYTFTSEAGTFENRFSITFQ